MAIILAGNKINYNKNLALSAIIILIIFSLQGYFSTFYSIFDPSMENKLSDSLASAYSYGGGGGGGGGGGTIKLPLPQAWEVELLSPEEAYERLVDFEPVEIAGVLNEVKISKIVAVLDYFENSVVLDIIVEMSPDKMSDLLLALDQEIAAQVIIEFNQTHVDIIRNLVGTDKNQTAILIEEAVKILISGIDAGSRPMALEQLASTLGALDTDIQIELLVEISKLPNTPITVAYILESMTLIKSSEIVENWIESADIVALAEVFSYLGDNMIGDLYRGLSGSSRETIYPYFSTDTIQTLPNLGEYQVSMLTALPAEAEPGETIEISFVFTNIGIETDDYVALLRINGDFVKSFLGLLGGEDSRILTYSQVVDEVGEYEVEVYGVTTTFTVVQPTPPLTPAVLLLTRLEISPEEIERGEEIIVFATFINEGQQQGSKLVDLKINNEAVQTKEITLEGGATITVYFNTAVDNDPGLYLASVEDLSTSFNIISATTNLPWISIIVILIIISGGAAYYLYERGILKIPTFLLP